MSNRCYIDTGKQIPDRDGEPIRYISMADDYGRFHDTDQDIPETPEDILQWLMDNPYEYCDEAVTAMLDFVVENEKGICINGEWIEPETVAEIYRAALNLNEEGDVINE